MCDSIGRQCDRLSPSEASRLAGAASGNAVNEVRRGGRFRVVVGSPNLPEGRRLRYALCVNKTRGEQCYTRKPWSFSGGFADVIVWRVAEHEGRDGILTTPL